MSVVTDPTKIEDLLTRRVDKIYPNKESLKKVLLSGKKLRLYQGFDPSTPNLHIGHLVGLLKLKEFQKMGHEVIFLIGDFTGMIGDPTGKDKTRKVLTQKQVIENAQTYKDQLKKILKIDGENPVKILFNSRWNSVLKFADILRLCGQFTIQQLLERDMFQKRLKEGKDISLAEFLYPVMQAYDCVAMDVDLEMGGSDQMFNMLVGRHLMHKLKGKEKFVLTTKLLEVGGKKMGKTEGNALNIANPPEQFFGQIMSLADDAILPCFKLVTQLPLEQIKTIEKALRLNQSPMKYKKMLAFELTKMLNGGQAAQKAQQEFEKVHQGGGVPQEIPTFQLQNLTPNPINIIDLLTETNLVTSRSEAKRLIEQGAVEINNKTIKPYFAKATQGKQLNNLTIKSGDIIKVGKRRWVKIN
jgi:tyrosyl-tRNA synthetase